MKPSEVFTPGKFPEHTFIDSHLVEKERLLKFTLDAGGSLISVSGPSKSGKTVFIEKVIGKENLIQVSGASIKCEDDLWLFVLGSIGTPIPQTTTEKNSTEDGLGSKLNTSINIGILKAEAGLSGSGKALTENSITSTTPTNLLELVAQELSGSGIVIFIDDFHYIEKPLQTRLANQIKELIRRDVRIICASVPYHSDDALRANADLQGRILSIDFEYWQKDILKAIADKGTQVLNVELPKDFVDKIVLEASGSPQLMQSLCLIACFVLRIDSVSSCKKDIDITDDQFRAICAQVASTTDFSGVYAQMFDGAKIRGSERKSFTTKDGKQYDVYGIVLNALALNPPQLTVRYKELFERVQNICKGEAPSGSSITSTCSQIAKIAQMNYPHQIIAWDSEVDVLEIRDPYMLFYMRWKDK